MPAQIKRLHVPDQVTPVKQEGRQERKGHGPREGEEVKASEATVQPPIQRPDSPSEMVLQSGKPIPREPDDPEPTPNPTTPPIQRPDNPDFPTSLNDEEDYPVSREPNDSK